ncbi:hypothetical protein BDV93DRAFT_541933 [Ceratobasidium sp. AG-I]|nr:hypothetical protein BDV93DRAFT_541933 [Ceratobasidium sp. AG-I]
MDKYLLGSKPTTSSQTLKSERASSSAKATRHHPYSHPSTQGAGRSQRFGSAACSKNNGGSSQQTKPAVSARKLTLALLSTLKDPENPITHSKAYLKTEHIVSCASGHQVNDDGGRTGAYMKARNARLESQAQERVQDVSVTVFKGLVVYVNGYCRGTTDAEIKRLVVSGGGQISHTNHGGVTHIITSMQLSASKIQKFKNTKSRTLTHVVTPDWVKECYEQRKRLPEWKYNVIDLAREVQVSG